MPGYFFANLYVNVNLEDSFRCRWTSFYKKYFTFKLPHFKNRDIQYKGNFEGMYRWNLLNLLFWMSDTKISVERHFKRATWKLWEGSSYRFVLFIQVWRCELPCIDCFREVGLCPGEFLLLDCIRNDKPIIFVLLVHHNHKAYNCNSALWGEWLFRDS